MKKKIVASYCTTFLKPEMLHIYRQITNLQKFKTFVICKERQNSQKFPFSEIEFAPAKSSNFIKRFYLKYIFKKSPIVYRGEYGVLEKLFKKRKTDLIHIYFGHTAVHLLPFLKEWKKQWQKPFIVSFHGMDVQERKHDKTYLPRLKELLKITPLVLARSKSLKQRLIDLNCDPNKIRINSTSIPMEKFPRKIRKIPQNHAWNIIQSCRFIEKKGLDITIKAFAEITQSYPNAHLNLAGDGPLKEKIISLISKHNLTKKITLLGFLNEKELNQAYQKNHIFIHPSQITSDQNQEGIPNSMLEAMATGLPVVATQHGGIPEAVTHGKDGFLLAEKDSKAIVNALEKIFNNPNLYQSMAEKSANNVRKKFAISSSIQKLESYYTEAIKIHK